MKTHSDLAIYRRIASETRPFRLHIAAIFVVSMLAAPLTLLTPVPLAVAVDSVIGSQALPGFLDAIIPSGLADSKDGILLFCALMFAGIAVLTQLQDLGNTILKTYTGEKLVLKFRSKLFQRASACRSPITTGSARRTPCTACRRTQKHSSTSPSRA